MKDFWSVEFLLLEQILRVDPYFQSFSTSSSWLPFLNVPSNSIKNWTSNYFIQQHSSSSIIMGYHGQLIKQSRITVRGRQSIDLTLQGKPKHTVGCPRKDNFPRLFPSIFSSGAEPTFLGTRLTGTLPHERPDSRRYHTVASRGTQVPQV
jgi:hypothetical protein